MTRNEARLGGFRLFFTGKPCSKGHVAERYVSSGACKACHEERETIRRQHVREFRQHISDSFPEVVTLNGLAVPAEYVDAILAVVNLYRKMGNLPPQEFDK